MTCKVCVPSKPERVMTPPSDWIVPRWAAPSCVRALCTTRAGGIAAPPFDGFNLGNHVGDDPASVAHHRAQLAQKLGLRPVFLKQVHGTAVLHLDAHSPDECPADASVSITPGVACTILVADCLPVLLAHRSGAAVAAAHAGWRGLAPASASPQPSPHVLQTTFNALVCAVQKTQPSATRSQIAADTLAWLGPCIGPSAFEVGDEVRQAFMAGQPLPQHAFVAHGAGKFLANLPAIARGYLEGLGIKEIAGNDGSPAWCTVGQPSRFFSHRRDARVLGSTGRMAVCIGLI